MTKLKNSLKKSKSIAEDKEIKKIAKKIVKCAEEAKLHGQSMEDRLYKKEGNYCSAGCNLDALYGDQLKD